MRSLLREGGEGEDGGLKEDHGREIKKVKGGNLNYY